MESEEERRLAARAGRGDRRALEELWLRHEARLQAMVRRGLGPALRKKLESGDILQSAFLDAVKDFSCAAKPGEDFLPWIARVIQRTIQDRARYFGRERRTSAREVPLDSEVGRTLAARTSTPSAAARTDEERMRLANALARLRAEDRRLVELSRIEKKTAKEIATLLGKSEEATQRAVNRAVARLSIELGADPGHH